MTTPSQPPVSHENSQTQPWPVSYLSNRLATYFKSLPPVWIEGEITQLSRRPGTTTSFFTIADVNDRTITMSVSCPTKLLTPEIGEGQRVVIFAHPSFWAQRGSFNLWVRHIELVGIGQLLARIEMLRRQLGNEGLFAAAHKKPLPFLPHRIGLICGRNARAKDDVIINTHKRWASVAFEIREVEVQGAKCVDSVIAALEELDADPAVDVIVITRGGGSAEDLLGFSDERLVRAVYAATTPVVSAIGHEADRPILDDVADVRASTPTDCAKILVPSEAEESAWVNQARTMMANMIMTRVSTESDLVTALRTSDALLRPTTWIDLRETDLAAQLSWLDKRIDQRLTEATYDLGNSLNALRALSPQSTLERGYSIVLADDGKPVTDAATLTGGQHLTAAFANGTATMVVEKGSTHV